jgi:hypothetical protein
MMEKATSIILAMPETSSYFTNIIIIGTSIIGVKELGRYETECQLE